MKSHNLHYAFYREYYNDLPNLLRDSGGNQEGHTPEIPTERNQAIISMRPALFTDDPLEALQGYRKLEMKTLYPGLLVGSGYAHQAGLTNEFSMGCTLHYATGLPYLPGSSVKGAIRSAFQCSDYIRELLQEVGADPNLDLNALTLAIFGPAHSKEATGGHRDVFLDAFPVEDDGQGLLEQDYLTPHKDPLSDPIPILFLKIRPDIRFRFRFLLLDSGGLTADQKVELFGYILEERGIGAKTNVGYGQLKKVEPPAQPQGICLRCGGAAGFDRTRNRFYDYCGPCQQVINREQARAERQQSQSRNNTGGSRRNNRR